MRGKAAVFYKPGAPFEIKEFEVPTPEAGAALVRVTAAGICGSDLHLWRGEFPDPIYRLAPEGHAFGHEMIGHLAALGSGLSVDSLGQAVKEGDRVCFPYFYPCRRCYQCQRGELAACPNKRRRPKLRAAYCWNGAFGEYYYLRPGHFLYKVPDALPDELVAPLNCALAQILYAFEVIQLAHNDTVVIQGAGALGLYAIAIARSVGAEQIIVIDGVPARITLAQSFGADAVIDLATCPTPADRVAQVFKLTNGRGADVAVDLVGLPAVIPEGLAMLRSGGRYVEIGCIGPGQTVVLDPSQIVFGSLRIQGVYHYAPHIIRKAFDFLLDNGSNYPFERLISHRFPLERINEAFDVANWQKATDTTDSVIRVLIIP